MKKIVYWSLIAVSIAASLSCTKNFIEKNTNPNALQDASPEALLAPALHQVVTRNQNRGMRIGNELMQVHVTVVESREFHRYFIRPSEPDWMWRHWYLQLNNIRDIYTSANTSQENGYQTFLGISLILDAWVSSMITDMFGDAPYFEASKGHEGNVQPHFDRQQDIYADIFRKLEEANELLGADVELPEHIKGLDPLYNGAPDAWRRFGNSLYLRLLLRVSGKAASGAIAKIAEIVDTNSGNYPIFTDNSHSAILPTGATQPITSEFFQWRDLDFNGDKGYSEFFINNLNEWQDPRLPRWATQVSGIYAGMPSGYAPGRGVERMSTLLVSLKQDPLLGNIMNCAELQFILAEAALKGYITGDPHSYYEAGVVSAITHWGLEVPEGHLEKNALKWDDNLNFNEKMERIHLQKYYTLFFTDFQQWHEHRRTGHPVLPKGEGLMNDGRMPSRLMYPINVQTLNRANYLEAVQAMGGDDLNVKVWWNTPD
ncbi:SusD/RagB family nutrient-binding outer membrane lipoprotein [Parapedobacter luteus]|nr:SusD/RagB family nutrient-binding outer membrane lipoprotein [Parapedobacter luteus]